jgi:hypothetical protein
MTRSCHTPTVTTMSMSRKPSNSKAVHNNVNAASQETRVASSSHSRRDPSKP